jgi:cysteine desulfurase
MFNLFTKSAYLDNNSSTPMFAEVVSSMIPYYNKYFYNASGKYAAIVKNDILQAKQSIFKILKANNHKLVFYGGGTDACSSAIIGVAFFNLLNKTGKNRIVLSALEHDSGVYTVKYLKQFGFEVSYIKVNQNGELDLEHLKSLLDDKVCLVSIMLANNEIGNINPIKEIAQIIKNSKAKDTVFHCDCIAAVGKMDISVDDLEVDIFSAAAHKFYGPKGVGFNIIKNGVNLVSNIYGSSQEYGLRAGTENTAGIIGTAKALEIVDSLLPKIIEHEHSLIEYFEEKIQQIPNIIINAKNLPRTGNTSSVSFFGVNKNDVIKALAEKNIATAGGAASILDAPSRVIEALNLPQGYALGTVRFSVGYFTKKAEIDYLFKYLPNIVSSVRK